LFRTTTQKCFQREGSTSAFLLSKSTLFEGTFLCVKCKLAV
jgi:hypothetical protein